MSREVFKTGLSSEERKEAGELWEALVFPASHEALEEARKQLVKAPDSIQQAIINEIAGAIRMHKEPHPDENPFVVA